jgi:hypothetical protein
MPFDVQFTSVESGELGRNYASRQGPKLAERTKGLGRDVLRAGSVCFKSLKPLQKRVQDLPEAKKIAFKRVLGLSWPEREIARAHGEAGRQLPDRSRWLREQGVGFTRIDKILAAGWQPPLSFAEGLGRTGSWLRAAKVLPEIDD